MPPTEFPEQLERPFEPARPTRPGRGETLIVRGIAAALALGLVGGLMMRPNLDDQPPAKQVAARKVEIPREPEGLEIIVAPPPQPVIPIQPPAPVEGAIPYPQGPAPIAKGSAAQPRIVNGAVMRPYREAVSRPARRARPSFNCRYARTTSERMVCVDPRLAAADRRLASAYHRAVASGVPERVLRRQQDIWLDARESAARYGPEDVARVYEARIAELEQMRY